VGAAAEIITRSDTSDRRQTTTPSLRLTQSTTTDLYCHAHSREWNGVFVQHFML